MSETAEVAIIGGTGFHEMPEMKDARRLSIETPYGPPSDLIMLGTLGQSRVAFLSRHGEGHRLLPSEVPQRANIWALASLGVQRVLSVSAVGSLKADIAPMHLVVPDQLIDNTAGQRPSTFFGEGVVGHISFADPFCRDLSRSLLRAGREQGETVHEGGTLVVIEGPAFSTRAESLRYRDWGAAIIGMTASPEAKLAREAGMCYATLACVTDYDTWHNEYASVTVDRVLENLQASVDVAKGIIASVVLNRRNTAACESCRAQAHALVTPLAAIPEHRQRDLAPILERYRTDSG